VWAHFAAEVDPALAIGKNEFRLGTEPAADREHSIMDGLPQHEMKMEVSFLTAPSIVPSMVAPFQSLAKYSRLVKSLTPERASTGGAIRLISGTTSSTERESSHRCTNSAYPGSCSSGFFYAKDLG
jgi:hypothetical protein